MQADDGEWAPMEAIVATSHRVAKYGGVALHRQALQQIVDALNDGRLPMLGNHDWASPVRTKDLRATLIQLEDGESAVKLVGLVDRRDWDAVGQIGGMSFTAFEPIGRAEGPHPTAPSLSLSADAGWFEDEAIGGACSILSALGPAEGRRLLQFSAIDDARIVLEVAQGLVMSLGPGLATSAMWDALKYLLSRKQRRPEVPANSPTRIELVTPLSSGDVIGIIDTSDPEVVRAALAAYSEALAVASASTEAERAVLRWRDDGADGEWLIS